MSDVLAPLADVQRPLAVTYTQTRVQPALRARLQQLPGILGVERSPLAETFKLLRQQLLRPMREAGQRVLAVTSPRDMAGKSRVALNLALALAADLNTTALLVDADLSGQGLTAQLGLAGEPGLSDHLSQGLPLHGLLLNPGIERLVLLPCGTPAPLHSAELLATQATAALVAELKARYPDRLIVIDLPPLLAAADALAVLPSVDTTLLAVEEHATLVRDLEAAAEMLAPFPLIGSVLCPVPERAPAAA